MNNLLSDPMAFNCKECCTEFTQSIEKMQSDDGYTCKQCGCHNRLDGDDVANIAACEKLISDFGSGSKSWTTKEVQNFDDD